MSVKVLITSNSFGKFDQKPVELMKEKGWQLVRNPYGHIMNEAEMKELVPGFDAIILGSDTLNRNVLACADQLKIISRYGVGLDNIDLEYAKEKNIKVTVTAHSNTEAVADYAVGLMLAVLRKICLVHMRLEHGNWQKETGMDLCHKTVGIVGLGSIGKEVAKRVSGFGCTILATDQYLDQAFCEQYNVRAVTLDELLANADVISLHAPADPSGQPLIGTVEFNRMKSTAVLINTARAALVDEQALLDVLKKKRIYGYGTDVFAHEPEINDDFRTLENVVLSPHNAAVSIEAINKMSTIAVAHLIEYFEAKGE